MNISIKPSPLSGKLKAIQSKSDAHRVLICAAVSQEPSSLLLENRSQDIRATIASLEALGAKIESSPDGRLDIKPVWGNEAKSPFVDCGESGSTLRFILPLAGAVSGDFKITAGGRLPYRPINPLIQALNINGLAFTREKVPLSVSGKLKSGHFLLPGHVSSQFVSGLLLTLPLLEGDSQIFLSSPLESAAYVDMTLKTLRDFGVEIERKAMTYFIKGSQIYRAPKNISIEGDWSNAAFWLAAGALGGKVTLEGLAENSLQSDKFILEILEKMGADIGLEKGLVSAQAGRLTSINFDAAQAPDLVPVVAALMAVAEGTSLIKNAGRLRLKESDRLKAMAQGLKNLGARVEVGGDYLKIVGKKSLKGGRVKGFNDHRIVMALAVLATKCEGNLEIEGAGAVKKSYPEFFEDFELLGGKVNVL